MNRSYYQKQPSRVEDIDVEKALTDPKNLSDEVQKLLSFDKEKAERFLGHTTLTAYRRVHEIVTSAIDRAITRNDPKASLIDFSKALIMVKYQQARDQISDRLARNISAILQVLIEDAKNSKLDRNKLISARTLLDALAVLTYSYGR